MAKKKEPLGKAGCPSKPPADKLLALEAAVVRQDEHRYVLRLYVTGLTQRSVEAIANVRQLCQSRLAGRYDLEVIDVSQQPSLARSEQIVATPTLVRQLPLPLRRLIGDLSDTERVLAGLDLKANDRRKAE
jgi:circadian clock protein KaiB